MDQTSARGEIELEGGFTSTVARVDDTVRRSTGPWSPAVHALLRHLESAGFQGAPRFLGIDDRGREILTYLDGEVPTGAHPDIVTDAVLADLGRMLRDLHRVTADFRLPTGTVWHFRSLGGPEPHVVCHHDLSPKNTAFRDGRIIGFIDWDLATPEAPIHDAVHAAWQFVPLATDEACERQGWHDMPDRGRRLRILLDAYGLLPDQRTGFAERVAARMETTATGIEALAREGIPAFVKLVSDGVPNGIRQDQTWIRVHADSLDAAIQGRTRSA
jgi:aminoglycoside phosphotransferase (APT) family kinase protein